MSRPRFWHRVRFKLLLVSFTLLGIPWAGYRFIQETEHFLRDAQDQALLKDRFKLLGPPAILLFDTQGRELRDYRVVGFMDAGAFADHLTRALQ